MLFEPNLLRPRMPLDGAIVGQVTVADQLQPARGRDQRQQAIEHPASRAEVAAAEAARGAAQAAAFLGGGAASGAGVRGGIQAIDEPRLAADGGGDPEGQILRQLEGFEVIENDRLVEPALERSQRPQVQQHRVAAESLAQARDGGRCAAERAGQLAMGRAGHKTRGDGTQQLGSLEVVGQREGPATKGAAAAQAAEARHSEAAGRGVAAVFAEAESRAADVVGAAAAGAEGRSEILQSIDGCARPVHAGRDNKERTGRGVRPSGCKSKTCFLATRTSCPHPAAPRTCGVRIRTQQSSHHHERKGEGPQPLPLGSARFRAAVAKAAQRRVGCCPT